MNNKKILLSIALSLVLTACQNSPTSQNPITDETITDALDGNQKALEETLKTETKDDKKEAQNTAKEEKKEVKGTDYKHWRDMIVNIGDFSKTVADNITDKELDEIINDAQKATDETGYRDTKDFVFQELGKRYPELSYKFPLDSVERKYDRVSSEESDITGKFEYQRRALIDSGLPSDEVWNLTDKEIEDAFKDAYLYDDELYFDDYVKLVGRILFPEEEISEEDQTTEDSNDKEVAEKSKTLKENMRYGSSQTDYDALKATLIQFYEFSPASVNQMTNEDIDIAYSRAMKRLNDTGEGNISLIMDELGKMYPGSSEMFPGNTTSEEDSN